MNDNITATISNAAPLQDSLLNGLVFKSSAKLDKSYVLKVATFEVVLVVLMVGPLDWDWFDVP